MKKNIQSMGLFISGTDTDVGKTYIGTQIVTLLHDKGVNTVPRKPIESGCQRLGKELIPADASQYFDAVHQKYPLAEICPFRFEPAISPQRAARLINQPVFLNEVVNACTKNASDEDYLVVEGAGGFYSPLCEDGKNSDLASALNLPVLLVAKDQLGCINHVLLTAEAIQNQGLTLVAVVLNQVISSEDDAMNNYEDLQSLIDVPIYLVSYNEVIKSYAAKSILETILS